jgi:hypothetical protein
VHKLNWTIAFFIQGAESQAQKFDISGMYGEIQIIQKLMRQSFPGMKHAIADIELVKSSEQSPQKDDLRQRSPFRAPDSVSIHSMTLHDD